MQQIVLQVRDEQKAAMLRELLSALDFVERVRTTEVTEPDNGESGEQTPLGLDRHPQRDRMNREVTAFESRHEELKESYLGQFVAMRQGKVIDSDTDEQRLIVRYKQRLSSKQSWDILLGMTKIHDSGYKKLFSNRTIFQQLMEYFIPQPWVAELDFDSCEMVDKSFVSDHYKETESDLIYKVKLRGENLYIYILIEFQSTAPRFMVVRVLNYITSFYLDYIESQAETKNLRLPVVFPIVLYNGENSWNAPVEIADLIEKVPAIGEYGLHFKYLLLDENSYSKETLLQIRNIVSTLCIDQRDDEMKKR